MTNSPDLGAPKAFELKGRMLPLTVLALRSNDMDVVASQLGAKVKQAPDFFSNMPVVIDLQNLPEDSSDVDFPFLIGMLRGFGFVPVAVRGGSQNQLEAAIAMELGILREEKGVRTEPKPDATSGSSAEPSEPDNTDDPSEAESENADQGNISDRESMAPVETVPARSKVVTRPIRSGQQVYAAGGDLVVVAPVSPGAELLADGSIHVYGALRGRALAGIKGNSEARIFCRRLEAELISIAGQYRVADDLAADQRGVPVQVFLNDRRLVIEAIE